MPDSILDWVAWTSPGVLILVGVALFFIPLPPTSLLGIVLILIGAAFWIVDYVGREPRERQRGRQSGGD